MVWTLFSANGTLLKYVSERKSLTNFLTHNSVLITPSRSHWATLSYKRKLEPTRQWPHKSEKVIVPFWAVIHPTFSAGGPSRCPKLTQPRPEFLLLSAKHHPFPTRAHPQSEAIIGNFTFLSKLSRLGCFMFPATAKPLSTDMSLKAPFHPSH